MGFGSSGWGSVAWGSGGYAGSAGPISVPASIQHDGGYLLSVTGHSSLEGIYRVHLGPNGDDTDPICYGGSRNPGRPNVEVTAGDFLVVSPPLPIGGPYAFHLVRLSGSGLAVFTTGALITVVAKHFRARAHNLGRILPPHYAVGARTVRGEKYPQS